MRVAPYVLGALSGYALLRAVFRPHKALVAEGSLLSCEGATKGGGCDPLVSLHTRPGEPVLGTAPGIVVAVGSSFVHVLARNEPVVLFYEGVKPNVQKGDEVGSGEEIGLSSGILRFGVWQLGPKGQMQVLSPSAWLASRGYKLASKLEPSSAWCAQGRTIAVPRAAGKACGFLQPETGAFALLPIKVSVER